MTSKWDFSVCCMGDSLTKNNTLGVAQHLLYPARIQYYLNNEGCNVVVRNFGRSGDTTQQMITRFPAMTQFAIPSIGINYAGTNDSSNGITAAQTQANLQSMITTLKNAGCNKILIIGNHFLNYSTGGDFDGSNQPLTDTTCYYASLIATQKAAASAGGAVYVDLFNFLRNRIVNGQDTAKSFSWHVADQNIHFNSYGTDLVAQCIYASIQAQGWDSQFK